MGSVFDVENVDKNPRCCDVKNYVIITTYAGIFISPILLIYGLIKMLHYKKRRSFITNIIIFIFFSELLNIFSKYLQFLKYAFEDTRTNPVTNRVTTPRGVICQIQIITSIISDFCTLLGTLLLSYRCYEVIKSKNRFFDKKKARIISFCIIIAFSIITSIILLIIDRALTIDLFGFKFDIRDRCSYWCWLEHKTGMACYSLFVIICISNVILACKTSRLLKIAYEKLKDQSSISDEKIDNLNDNNNIGETPNEKKNFLSEDKERIVELNMMRIKCRIYPIVTITIWFLLAFYRFPDDIIMTYNNIDYNTEKGKGGKIEDDFFLEYPFLRILEEINLVAHSFFSSFRGLAYGFCFIIFEEKSFWNFLKNKICCCFCYCFCCCSVDKELADIEKNENKLNFSNNSLLSNSTEKEINPVEENVRTSEGEFGRNNEMNNSNYHFNE